MTGSRCGHCEESLLAVSDECRWPEGTVVGVYHEMDLSAHGISPGDVVGVFGRACAAWSAVCGLAIVQAANPDFARVVCKLGPIDGPWNVLGLTYLPCGAAASAVMTMTLDVAEAWTLDMLEETVVHELGHALGLAHAATGSGNVMEPVLTALKTPQAGDIAEIQARYGPPLASPAPVPNSAPSPAPFPHAQPAQNSVTVHINCPVAGDYFLDISVRPATGPA